MHPTRSSATRGARAGDVLILGKPLGVGIYSAALKKDKLDAAGYAAMIANTTKLNTPGIALAELEGVHALTDVTGFGLLGHLLEICRGRGPARDGSTGARIPLLPGVQAWPREGSRHRRLRPQLGRATGTRSR